MSAQLYNVERLKFAGTVSLSNPNFITNSPGSRQRRVREAGPISVGL
jgi:hypothetical protein